MFRTRHKCMYSVHINQVVRNSVLILFPLAPVSPGCFVRWLDTAAVDTLTPIPSNKRGGGTPQGKKEGGRQFSSSAAFSFSERDTNFCNVSSASFILSLTRKVRKGHSFGKGRGKEAFFVVAQLL